MAMVFRNIKFWQLQVYKNVLHVQFLNLETFAKINLKKVFLVWRQTYRHIIEYLNNLKIQKKIKINKISILP